MIRLADLETLDRAALLAAWSQLFGSPAPKKISRPLLLRFLAFELQARERGGLPKSVLADLARAARAGKPAHSTAPRLKPGGRLLREWNGITNVVEVTSEGYLWRGTTHRSLSAIARAITGAHWSGPRFFGLGQKAGQS
ncbi:DUF2924 domain-containing protein [Defluviimonas sp. SAOS-178_SWC]|uniref:DUF2924 domain-containing protein n=1 Tax=Defluviimonas sp. SAOS-178_SWC TaxID=3121287 RepID=UPI0032218998